MCVRVRDCDLQEFSELLASVQHNHRITVRAIQQADIRKGTCDKIRQAHRSTTQQFLAVLLRRQSYEADPAFGRDRALQLGRIGATDASKVYAAVHTAATISEALDALSQDVVAPPRSCAAEAAAAAGGEAPRVEFCLTRSVKRVKREPASPSLNASTGHQTPRDTEVQQCIDSAEEGLFSEEEEQ